MNESPPQGPLEEQEESLLVPVPGSSHLVTIVSTLSFHPVSESVEVDPGTSVGDLLRRFLDSNAFPHRGKYNYCLRDESGLVLSPKDTLGELDSQSLMLYLCVETHVGGFTAGHRLLVFVALYLGVAWTLIILLSLIYPDEAVLFIRPTRIRDQYGVVLDAGSVHSNIAVYQWNAKINDTGLVKEIFSCETAADQGISSFLQHPEQARDYLLSAQCLSDAINQIPQEQVGDSSVFLGATAGLRVLNATYPVEARQIMGNLSVALNQTGLRAGGHSAEILSGEAEGIMGWISSNYLSQEFPGLEGKPVGNHTPLGALDWGGASSQITFTPHNSSRSNRRVTLFGHTYELFTSSHLCYGQAEGLRRYYVRLIHQGYLASSRREIPRTVKSPCQPTGAEEYKVEATDLFYSPCTRYKDQKFSALVKSVPRNATFNFTGESNGADCRQELAFQFDFDHCLGTYKQPHCLNPADIPLPTPHMRFLAFSTYWYLLSALQVNQTHVSLEHFEDISTRLCSSPFSSTLFLSAWGQEYRQNSCFKSVFMQLLLRQAYRMEEWTGISFVKRVSDADVGWTLGYMLERTNHIASVIAFPVPILLLVGAIVLIPSIWVGVSLMIWAYCRDGKNASGQFRWV